MKFSRLYLIVTGQTKPTDDEAALIMQSVRFSFETFKENGMENNPIYKDTFAQLSSLIANTEDLPWSSS